MKTIWKYKLEAKDEQRITMPDNGDLLAVQVQRGEPCIWVLVDPREPLRDRVFIVRGTGHEIDFVDALISEYIGTFQLEDGSRVFHVFDLGYVQKDEA